MTEHAPSPVSPEGIAELLGEEGRIALVAQPIIDVRRVSVVGYEMLARFRLAQRVAPDQVFAAAARAGRGAELEARTVTIALDMAAQRPDDCFVAVNVDPAHLAAPQVDAALDRSLDGIVVELTEHNAVGDLTALKRRLDALRDRGAIVALDDAGSGYSGLKQLLALEPEIVKLDRELVAGLHENEAKRVMVQMLGELAGRLDAWVLAEGVETEEEADALAKLRVPLAQGYFFSHPKPPWAPLALEAHRFLHDTRCRHRSEQVLDGLDALLAPCAIVTSDAAWPDGARLVLRIDATRRVNQMRIASGPGRGRRRPQRHPLRQARHLARRWRSTCHGANRSAALASARLRRRAGQAARRDHDGTPRRRTARVARARHRGHGGVAPRRGRPPQLRPVPPVARVDPDSRVVFGS